MCVFVCTYMHACIHAPQGPEELLTSLTKGGFALFFCWPLTSLMGASMQHVANFWVHAGLAVLFKCLLQMSVFASLVQTMLPEWDPARRRTRALLTPDIKCRVCFETGLDLRRCPCRCTGSVGYIHPVCFQQVCLMLRGVRGWVGGVTSCVMLCCFE